MNILVIRFKLIVSIFTLVILLFSFSHKVSAHPGNTDVNGCHYCTSCTPYGNLYEWDNRLYEYFHCHNANVQNIENITHQDVDSISNLINKITPHSDQVIVVQPINSSPTIDDSWFENWKKNNDELEKTRLEDEKRSEELIIKNKQVIKEQEEQNRKYDILHPTIPSLLELIERDKLSETPNLKPSIILEPTQPIEPIQPTGFMYKATATPSQQKNIILRIFDWIRSLLG